MKRKEKGGRLERRAKREEEKEPTQDGAGNMGGGGIDRAIKVE